MPRVKIDYVVSFSSEDPDNPASNLLGWDVSKKRWLCPKGEPSCSVVLQLPRAVKVNAVHVGAHHAALVEVLVGRSETPNEPFQVLVPSCIFLTPAESRREENVERVRSFSAEQLAAGVRDQRWDRLRVVCTQPYNKHCKYGVNFVHVYSSEGHAAAAARGGVSRLLRASRSSSDDEFAAGELFARHRAAHTGALIRQATSQALKNISDSATKLVKTPISKNNSERRDWSELADAAAVSARQRDDLLYTDDDDQPHAKIDHIVQRHKDEKSKYDSKNPKNNEKHDKKTDSLRKEVKKEESKTENRDRHKDESDKTSKEDKKNRTSSAKQSRNEPSTSGRRDTGSSNKRPRDTKRSKKAAGAVLQGVVFALSGYAHPRRGELRARALRLGARAERDWGAACTHLICAFPNTPKLKQVRAAPGGAAVPVATGEWLEQCHARRRRLPWRWFATEPRDRTTPQDDPDDTDDPDDDAPDRSPSDDNEECDTDDEIEKALRKQKKPRTEGRGSPAARDADASGVVFVRDERMRGHVALDASGDDTDHEDAAEVAPETIDASAALPDIFDGCTFLIDDSVERAAFDKQLLARYVRAYGGLVVEDAQLDEAAGVDYVVCAGAAAGRRGARVRPDWLWRCHRARRLLAD